VSSLITAFAVKLRSSAPLWPDIDVVVFVLKGDGADDEQTERVYKNNAYNITPPNSEGLPVTPRSPQPHPVDLTRDAGRLWRRARLTVSTMAAMGSSDNNSTNPSSVTATSPPPHIPNYPTVQDVTAPRSTTIPPSGGATSSAAAGQQAPRTMAERVRRGK
jgi:hypothetical protein